MTRQIPKFGPSRNQGFTIIEVLIVLAIAGLIMVVVFLAVPNLQRNQRITAQRTEANNILVAAGEIMANHAGNLPTSTDAANILTAANAQTVTSLTVEGFGATTVPATTAAATLRTGAKCTAATGDTSGTIQGSSRQIALIYNVEKAGGGVQVQCRNN